MEQHSRVNITNSSSISLKDDIREPEIPLIKAVSLASLSQSLKKGASQKKLPSLSKESSQQNILSCNQQDKERNCAHDSSNIPHVISLTDAHFDYPNAVPENNGQISLEYELTGNSDQQKQEITDLSPIEILKSPVFWAYAITTIFQQGLTYIVNVTSIITASDSYINPQEVAMKTTLHVTLISIFQSLGRLAFGIACDFFASSNSINPTLLPSTRGKTILSKVIYALQTKDRTVLLLLAQIILLLPPLTLTIGLDSNSDASLIFCSVCVGLGWGAGGALFPPLTRDFFGTKYYVCLLYKIMGDIYWFISTEFYLIVMYLLGYCLWICHGCRSSWDSPIKSSLWHSL